MSRIRQFAQKSAKQIAEDFISSFDNVCRKWLEEPDMSDEDISEYQNSQHWMMMIGQYYGKMIGIARMGVGGQLVAARGKVSIWNRWLEKLDDMVSDERFENTKERINQARLMKKFKETKIGAYLGPDEQGAVQVFAEKHRK